MVGGALVIAYLDPAVLDMRPLDALRLVDLGFPIPDVDPGGAVRKERDKSSVEPARAASSGGASVGSDSVVATVEFGAVSGVPPGACPSEAELWAARLVNFKGSDLLQPLHGRDGFYHLVQDQVTVDGILSEELPPDEYYCELSEVLRRKFPLADPTLIDRPRGAPGRSLRHRHSLCVELRDCEVSVGAGSSEVGRRDR